MVLLTLILTYLPMPVSSLPIVIFQDRNIHASNSSYVDDKLVFDVSFTFALLIALLITYVWITARMNVDLFISWVNRMLAASIALVEQVVDQLSHFRFDTIFRIAASILVDANEARRDYTRPMGGLANPTSTTARFILVNTVSISDRALPFPRPVPNETFQLTGLCSI